MATTKVRYWLALITLVGLLAGMAGAYMQTGVIPEGKTGTGVVLIGIGFSLLIAALNQAIAMELRKGRTRKQYTVRTVAAVNEVSALTNLLNVKPGWELSTIVLDKHVTPDGVTQNHWHLVLEKDAELW